MIIQVKLGRVRALTIEFNRDFGFWPLYKKTAFRCETIFDVPYTQVIFTSGAWTPLRRASNDDTIIHDKGQPEVGKTSAYFGGSDGH